MKLKRLEVYIFTLLLAAAAVFCYLQERSREKPLVFLVETGTSAEKITCWQREEGENFVFLPSFAELSKVRIHVDQPVRLDEWELSYGDTCESIRLNQTYTLFRGGKEAGTITFMKSGNLPAMYIDTASGSMEAVHAVKGTKEDGTMRLYDSSGGLNYSGILDWIKGRGNTSFESPKKPYNLKLRSNEDLLGMGAAKRWILLGDSTNLNNKLVFDFAAAAGLPYSPDSRWVDLYLNGEYAGLYLLTERNEIHPQRIDVPENESFLVSKEQPVYLFGTDRDYFVTEAGASVRIRSGTLSPERIQSIFQSAESAILAADGIDPKTGKTWLELIDLDSWVIKYLVEEVFYGIDSAVGSQFFFYREDGKIYAGPVWDYDDTLHSVWIGGEDLITYPDVFYAHRSRECPWFRGLYEKEEFQTRLRELYGAFSETLKQYSAKKLPEYGQWIEQSFEMSRIRWDNSDLKQRLAGLQAALAQRLAFLDGIWLEWRPFAEVTVDFVRPDSPHGSISFDYVVSPGECLPEIPKIEGYTWYITGTDTPFDSTQPIYESMGIELRPN